MSMPGGYPSRPSLALITLFALAALLAGCGRVVTGAPATQAPAGTSEHAPTYHACATVPPMPTVSTVVVTAMPSANAMQWLTAKIGWVVSEHGQSRTTDGGRSWSSMTPPGGADADFISPQLGWSAAVSDAGVPDGAVVYSTTDGGLSWRQLATLHVSNVLLGGGSAALSFVDAQHGWLAYTYAGSNGIVTGGALYATTDGGQSWVQRAFPPGGNGMARIRFVSSELGYIGYDPENPKIDVTRDGGVTWSPVAIPWTVPDGYETRTYELPTFFTTLDGAAILTIQNGCPSRTGGLVAVTHDGGLTWRQAQTRAAAVAPDVTSAWILNTTDNVAALSADQGQTWTMVTVGRVDQYSDLTFLNAHDAWAIGHDQDCPVMARGCHAATPLVRSTDGGRTWRSVTNL